MFKLLCCERGDKSGNDGNPGETVLSGLDWFSHRTLLLFSPGLISFTAVNDRPVPASQPQWTAHNGDCWKLLPFLYESSNLHRRIRLPSPWLRSAEPEITRLSHGHFWSLESIMRSVVEWQSISYNHPAPSLNLLAPEFSTCFPAYRSRISPGTSWWDSVFSWYETLQFLACGEDSPDVSKGTKLLPSIIPPHWSGISVCLCSAPSRIMCEIARLTITFNRLWPAFLFIYLLITCRKYPYSCSLNPYI